MGRRRRPAVGTAPPPRAPPLQKLTLTKPMTQVYDKYMTFVTQIYDKYMTFVTQIWLELVLAEGGGGGRSTESRGWTSLLNN